MPPGKITLEVKEGSLEVTTEKTRNVFQTIAKEEFPNLYEEKGEKIIHWLPKQKDLVKTEVLMPDKKLIKGLAEPMVEKLKENDVIQFARFGFCRLDKKEKNKLCFWFTHR